jgi:hypothetical protein
MEMDWVSRIKKYWANPCTCPDDSWSLREVSLFCPVHGDEYANAIRGHLDASGYKSNITVEIIKKEQQK